MPSRTRTGGVKEFGDHGPLEETEHTKAFKEAYRQHVAKREKMLRMRKQVLIGAAIIIAVSVLLYLLLRIL